MIRVFTASSLTDIFPETKPTDRDTYALHMARNEGEGFQIGVYAPEGVTELRAAVDCAVPHVTFEVHGIGLVPFSKNTVHIGSRSVRAKAPGVLPEYFTDLPLTVPAGESRALYVSVRTDTEAPAGDYAGTVRLEAEGFAAAVPFTLRVYDVTLPPPEESAMTYVCWSTLTDPDHTRNVYGIEMWSEEYWTYVRNCARIMRSQRQNMISMELQNVLLYRLTTGEDGQLQYDFTMFDKFAEIMLDKEYMGVRYLCGMHMMARDWFYDVAPGTSWSQRPLIAWVFEKQEDGTYHQAWKPASDPCVEAFQRHLFTVLGAHLREKGWDKIWFQHVSDEIDNDIHYQQTLAVYQIIHECMPGARTIDAVRPESPYTFGAELDIHVPTIWQHDMAPYAYAALQRGNTEVWQYTCLQPQYEYLSRLGDYPLAATRLLGWYNYRWRLTGFLHYAWNNYNPCVKRYDPYADASCFGSFPCDAFIVYPDREHLTVHESVRSEAQRDAFEDYELWRLAEQKAPDTVRRLAEAVVPAANAYTRNTEFLAALRIRLLEIAQG